MGSITFYGTSHGKRCQMSKKSPIAIESAECERSTMVILLIFMLHFDSYFSQVVKIFLYPSTTKCFFWKNQKMKFPTYWWICWHFNVKSMVPITFYWQISLTFPVLCFTFSLLVVNCNKWRNFNLNILYKE